MTSEKEILQNMHNTISDFVNQLKNTKNQINNIEKEIHNLNNNYFTLDNDNIYVQFSEIFDFYDINNLEKNLQIFGTIINDKINNTCEHEWIDDDVEVDVEMSQKIWYCNICGISKK